MSEIISSAILFHYRKRSNTFPEFVYTDFCGDGNLIDLMFQYNEQLGVDAYNKYEDGTIQWRARGKWYSSEQIDRMLALKVFC